MLCALCVGQASALEYTMEAPDDYLFGRPTSDDTIYEWEDPNVDRSKNTALIPPGFGTPTSYLPGSGDPLTPNLIPGALDGGGLVSQTGSVNYPVIDTGNGGSSGQDVGYAAMKTVHFSFPTGLVEYEHEPYTQKDVLEYGGRYYVVGSGRQPLQRDKTQTEDYYLLTLAAIAKELEHRGAEHTASIHLAAGLPLTSFGRDKKSFRSYLYRDGSAIPFRYEGQDYTITIREVSLFPQGYAAVLTQTELLDEPSVIVADIGGWTVDLMRLDNRIPNAASCRSLELGMIRCIDEISEQVRRLFGLSMTTAQIESALRGSSGGMDERIRAVIHAQAGKYARNLLSAVTESGLDIRAMPTIFLGGGAALLKRHLSATDGLCRPLILDDVSLNAKGYERLVGQMSRGVGHGG